MSLVFKFNVFISGELPTEKHLSLTAVAKKNEDSLEVKQLHKSLKETQLELEILKKGRSYLFHERWEVYQFIASYKHLFPVEKMCKILKVSRSSYYRWF